MFNVRAKKEKFLPTPESIVTMRPHCRQFVLGPKAFLAYDDWCCRQLDPSTWVSYCPNLRVGWTKDADGVCWGLFGLAVESLEEKLNPLLEIAQTCSAKVPELYPSWAGRWVLLGQGQVHMDVGGLLGCFYGTSDSQMWVSSSPDLLAHILFPDELPLVDPRPLVYEVGISWFTPPRSRFSGIGRLLPSQVINLNDSSIRSRPLMPPIDPSRGYEETLELLKRSLVTTLKRLAEVGSKIWLGLSAGYDSRVILALSRYADIEIMPFTRVMARISVADRLLPPRLAHECGYDHVFIRGGRSYRERKHLVAGHTAGHVSTGDAEPFVMGVRAALEGIFIGGQCFAVGKVLWRHLLPDTFEDPEIGAYQIAQALGEPLASSATAGICEWLQWVQKTPQEHLDWRDRFYIEQRLAGWQSSKEQLFDLDRVERFFVINSARNYALLLELEESRRVGCQHHVELCRRVAPQLLNYPFNPDDLHFGILTAIASKSLDGPEYVYRKVARKLRWMQRSLLMRG